MWIFAVLTVIDFMTYLCNWKWKTLFVQRENILTINPNLKTNNTGESQEEKPKKLIILDANEFKDVAQFVQKILDCKLDERILFINLNKNRKIHLVTDVLMLIVLLKR